MPLSEFPAKGKPRTCEPLLMVMLIYVTSWYDLAKLPLWDNARYPAYHIERSVFELNRTQSNVNRTIKFDFVWSSNEIELTKNKCKSNQIERSIKSVDVRFSSVAERHLSERLTSSHDMIWIERMFGFPSFDYHGDKCLGKCVNRSSHLKLCFLYFHTYFSFRPDIHRVCQHFQGICYPGFYHGNEFHEFCNI